MKNLTWALAALFIAACASQEQKPAEPTARAPEQGTVKPAPAPQSRPQASTDPLTQGNLAKRSVYYAFDKSDIAAEYRPVVEAHAAYLKQNPNRKVRIEGNADERGSREYNLALGQRRSSSVMKAMTLLGAPERSIEAVSYGEEKPKATGHDEASWAENRRADIVYP